MLSVDELETSARKGKFAVTPPTSPLAFNSFGSQQNGGVYGSSTPTSPTRQMSDSGDDGIDGKYSHKSEFNFSFITNGGSNTLKSNTSGSPKNGYDNGGFDKRGSNFSEDKYKWNDEPTVRADTAPGNSKTATRKICVCVLVTLLILGIIAGAVAVILKYKVFDTGEDDVPDVTTTIRPEELSIEGSLDLNQTWTRELDDPASQLYINTTDTFTAEIDRIMENSSFADVYIRTVVLDLSPGSIKVKFRMHNNGRYKLQSNSPAAYTTAVQDHIKDASRGARLPIVRSSVILQALLTTTPVPPTSPRSHTTPSTVPSTVPSTAPTQRDTSSPNPDSTTTPVPPSSSISHTTSSTVPSVTPSTASTQSNKSTQKPDSSSTVPFSSSASTLPSFSSPSVSTASSSSSLSKSTSMVVESTSSTPVNVTLPSSYTEEYSSASPASSETISSPSTPVHSTLTSSSLSSSSTASSASTSSSTDEAPSMNSTFTSSPSTTSSPASTSSTTSTTSSTAAFTTKASTSFTTPATNGSTISSEVTSSTSSTPTSTISTDKSSTSTIKSPSMLPSTNAQTSTTPIPTSQTPNSTTPASTSSTEPVPSQTTSSSLTPMPSNSTSAITTNATSTIPTSSKESGTTTVGVTNVTSTSEATSSTLSDVLSSSPLMPSTAASSTDTPIEESTPPLTTNSTVLESTGASVKSTVGASSTSTVTPTSTSTISSTSSTTSTSPNTTTSSTTSTPNTTTSSTTTTTPSTTSTTVTTPNTTTSSTSTTSTTVTTPNTTTSSTTTSTSTTTTPTTTTEVDHPPIARAGTDVTMTLPTNAATLDGSGSSDDKGITSYQWQKVSGPQTMDISGVNTDSPHVSNLVAGVYTLRLTVRDVRGHTSSDTVTITVNPEPTTTSTTTTTPMPDLCTPVTFEPCMSRGFTQTVLPNLFNHINQSQAAEAYNEVAKDVFNQICQESALTYLCTLYFPKCSPDTGEPEYACLSLCEESITTCGNYFTNPFPCEYFVDANCTGLMTTTPGPVTTTQTPTCEDTYVEECMALGFTETQFPNLLYEPTQESANETFYMYFLPEIEGGCHENLLYFICSLQFPKCIDGLVYKPCQRVCQETSEACPDVNYFNCSDFPEIDCMAPIQPKAAMLSRKRLHCSPNQFSCNKVTKCISNDLVCNGVDDCGDWTDEMDCVCGEYQYQCAMGMCIKSYQRCDGTNHCPDRSDELNCQGCTHGQVACPSGKCIMSEWICDGRSECEDGWDENNCDVCGDRYFTCADRNRTCIPLSNRCDGVRHCPDGYDEFECIMDELGELHLPVHKTDLPICASSWSEMYGDYTCELLGRGPYINKTDVFSNLPVFLKLSSSGSATQLKSVLGPVEVQYDCPGNKAVKINCEPRGCGKRMMKIYSDYVVNGEDAKPGAWPWHAALYYGGQYFCGGSLISNEFILTAAHCVEKRSANYGLMTVKLGVNHRSRDEETQHVVKVEAVHSHMDHVYFVRNDIALIQLEKPVNFTKYIQPICLPTETEELPLYSSCFTVGWGKTKWSGDYSEVLQQLKMTLWDTNKCNSSIAWNGSIYDTFLCAGYYSGVRSICTGDSGGPLLCEDATRTWKLHGVSSYVANYCNMTERPNIFTDVRDLMPWIQDKIECKFRCDNGKCLYNRDYLCDRVDHCGDNSDETRICNKTVTCDFEDKFLCGYQFSGWEIGQDNRNSTRKDIGGVFYTESNAPQFDNTIGKFPGHFCFGKHSGVLDADLTTPRFITSGQTCIRFAYYLRGDVKIGLRVMMREFYGATNNYTLSTKWPLRSAPPKYSPDEWKTGYFDLTMGQFVMIFTTGDLLMAAIDDVEMIPGMCSNVLCKSDEFWCRGRYEDKCIPRESNCNLVVDCEGEEDENQCTQGTGSYVCTFENGNACGLRQEIGDSTDWWLVNASFVQDEIGDTKFQDHTDQSDGGNVFYLHRYAIQFDTHIYMWQLFYLNSQQYCFSFYYQLRKDGVTFNIYLDCPGCVRETHIAQSTFDNKWALFQVTLPVVDVINVTYDVFGDSVNQFYSFITIDDIFVKPGICPEYVCPANYTKCRKTDRCIPVKSLCDRNVDCMDEFDEENCNCNAAEYRCDNGRCIPGNLTCDRTTQCLDGSDEGNICVPLRNVTCTFEHPYVCGYEYLRYTNYKWRNHQGYTPTPVTGPDVDHTYKNSSGHFMYAEANEGSKGDNSSIISPEFVTSPGQSLLFFYHMFSYSTSDHSPGALEFRLVNQENGQIVFQWYADITKLADIWQELCYDLPSGLRLKAWFTAIRNETTTYGVDIAIDDVQLNPYTCAEMETTKSSYRPTASRRTTMAPTATTAPSGSTCAADQWQCRSYQCIPADYRCDGEGDCTDDSDEDNCP